MENLFERLARRARTEAAVVEPQIAPRFAPLPEFPEGSPEEDSGGGATGRDLPETGDDVKTLPDLF